MHLTRPTEIARQKFLVSGWELYQMPLYKSFLWIPFKLIAPPGTEKRRGSRRSFWLSWNPDLCRLADGRDVHALKEQDPELYASVLLLLDMTFDRAWLLGQYDEAEISAERSRLKAMRANHTAVSQKSA